MMEPPYFANIYILFNDTEGDFEKVTDLITESINILLLYRQKYSELKIFLILES